MTMHLRPLSCGIAALGLTIGLAACNNDPQSGTLRVQYDFATQTSCDQHPETVIDVRVEIGDALATETVTCDNAGGELVVSAPAGTHDILVQGIDPENDAVLDNLGGQITDDRVEVIGGESKDFPVELSLVPARLEVALVVTNNGIPAQCTSNSIMVQGLRAQAWNFAAGLELRSHDFDLCEFDDFLPVPDEDRDINGRVFDAAVLQPIDANGGDVGPELEVPFAGPVGAGKAVQIQVSCAGDTCEATILEGDPGPTTDTEDPTGGDPTSGGSTGMATTGGESGTGADSTGGSTGG